MKFSILYGIDTANIDVTEIAMNKCLIRNRICIPSGEQNRANLFTDPLPNVLKILETVNLIIMENDYHDISHKQYIDSILLNSGFYVDYVQSGGWGPCYNNFFEVWKR